MPPDKERAVNGSDFLNIDPPDRADPPGPRSPGPPTYPDIVEGPGYHYRAQQVLVNRYDLDLVSDELLRLGGERDGEATEQFRGMVVVFRMPPDVDIPTLVDRLRAVPEPGRRQPRVGPNHILTAGPNYHGGPFGDPIPAPDPPAVSGTGASPITVAVLDTGIEAQAETRHPLLKGRLGISEPDDVYDPVTLAPHIAKDCGGHGTFVAGIIAALAPSARINTYHVLSPQGVGDEGQVSHGVFQAVSGGASVINASLMSYGHSNDPIVGLMAVLEALHPSIAVVAAAGNDSKSDPAYPAAFKRVAGVTALDTSAASAATASAASFTNWGSWVDFCAPGVAIGSTWVEGDWLDVNGVVVPFLKGARWNGTSFATPHVAAAIVNGMQAWGVDARTAEFRLKTNPNARRISGHGVVIP
jgi:subtilisin family serine protease